jgi:hypothetical protein
MKIPHPDTVTTPGQARDLAIDWQHWVGSQSLSLNELNEWAALFETLAERHGLTEEFSENGLIDQPATEDIRIPVTPHQAEWLADLIASGSESMAAAADAGARIEGGVLVIPPAAAYALGLAVGIRADPADEGEYTLGERSTVLGLARKLANAGITNAAPLVIEEPGTTTGDNR